MTKKSVQKTTKSACVQKKIKDRKVTYLMAARQYAAKLHQQNIQMIESSDMTKQQKALALKRIKAAYCR